ncbi:MAG: 4a-hydroxytetrahydrobiopterin dehydratase [Planctomycetaceae bacterium]
MAALTPGQLVKKKCVPCEGGVPVIKGRAARELAAGLSGWRLTRRGRCIRKDWLMRDFAAAMQFLRRVGKLAEDEWHHPDLHLEGFRKVWIELTTHAIGGLSENDFILAAKIDRLPVALKKPK